ncbi:MAG: hypothetical protein NWE89_11130 [Candidatus Bathyarchaeota archaeon]|nr:hypothetical protein [Candidatus Bathyarchaeota archaeon]
MSRFQTGDIEVPEEEIEEILRKTAERIHLYGMETVAIMTLESIKPMVYVGGELSRLTLSPFMPALGPDFNLLGEKLILVFEDRKNIDKLIDLLEAMAQGEYESEEEEPVGETTEPVEEPEKVPTENTTERKGWRRFFPF